MYALVANGIQTVVRSQEQLDLLISIYPYPKFRKCRTESDAREWIRQNSRADYGTEHRHYGDPAVTGYAEIEYFIADNTIYCNINTRKCGFIKIRTKDLNVKLDQRREFIKMKIENVVLNDDNISHHMIAIQRILIILGPYVDVDITVPDISVFLAATRYKGNNYILQDAQEAINSRLGAVSFTIREES